MTLNELWHRLKNDIAFRVGTVYAGASWFVVEALDTLGVGPETVRRWALVLAVGFLVVVPVVWLLDRQRRRAGTDAVAAGASGRLGRRGTRRWAAAVVVLFAVAVGLWAFRSRLSGGPVPEAATRLAVLPFQATGSEEVREYGVGMVNLLSAALSDVGGIRTVPSQTVLARVDGGSVPTLEDQLALGAALDAASVLTGTITTFGGNVRINGAIRVVPTGEELATAEVQGPLTEILSLTDRLGVELLRELWRSRAPLPTVRASALTTSSPAALSAFLRGEAFLRALREDSAFHFFERATQLDSTFAMAWLRLADAAGWVVRENDERRLYWAGRALQFIDRLPEREASLVRAYHLRLSGSLAAIDSLVLYAARYPDDPMGQFELGDVRFHTAQLGLHTDEDITRPFLEASRLDPNLALGLVHVLDMTLDHGDSAAFHSALERFARVAPAERVESFHAQARVRWAPTASLLATLAAELKPLHPVRQRTQINHLIGALGNRVRLDPTVPPRAYDAGLDTILSYFGEDRYFQRRALQLRGIHFGTLGMADSVTAVMDRWLALREPSEGPPMPRNVFRAMLRAGEAAEGGLPFQAVAPDVALLEQHLDSLPTLSLVLTGYYAAAGTPERARGLKLPPLEMLAPPGADTVAVRLGAGGIMAIMRGDTTRGLRDFEASLERIGTIGALDPGWRQYGEVLSTIPERRAQAIRILRYQTVHTAVNTGQSFLSLARALEQDGDRAGAREAYGHVLRLWNQADEHRHAARAEAARALERLAGEPPR